jgi:hypothetical protein
MRLAALIFVLSLSGCSWFHRRPPPPVTQQLIVTGVPAGSTLLVDGKQTGEGDAANRSHVIDVASGTHTVEVRMGDNLAYRESTYVAPGERRVVAVLSGDHRD